MTSPRFIIQSAVFSRLDALLDSSIRVTDFPDTDTPCPFVDIGDSDISEGDDKTSEDYDVLMKIKVVTTAEDQKGTKNNSDIQEQVRAALTTTPLSLGAGWQMNYVTCRSIRPITISDDSQYFTSELDFSFNFQKT